MLPMEVNHQQIMQMVQIFAIDVNFLVIAFKTAVNFYLSILKRNGMLLIEDDYANAAWINIY